jgi:hypothetical protein
MPQDDDSQDDLFMPIGIALPRAKALSQVKRRLSTSAVAIDADDPDCIVYQHTVLCQTCLPYRNPGETVRRWRRVQGSARLEIEAGRALDPQSDDFIDVGLPFGPKPRLILAHLNAEAIRCQSPLIEVGNSLTEFVKRIRCFDGGREIRAFKDQLGRLSASLIRLAFVRDGRASQVDSKVISGFDLWFPRDERQRVLWPSIIRLSAEYFESLQEHGVPLDERALSALAHSALALDVYAWLAQRLCRIDPNKPVFIPWPALQAQFGPGYDRLRAFRASFKQTLATVLTQYPGARVGLDENGLKLRRSPPPVPKAPLLVTSR